MCVVELPTTIDQVINSPTSPLPERTQKLIDLIVDTAPLRDKLDYRNKSKAAMIADMHEEAGLLILADSIRLKAGLIKKSALEKKPSKEERFEFIERIKSILIECEQIRPDDLAAELDFPRRNLDKITGYMRRNGMLITVHQKYYQLTEKAIAVP